MIYAYPWCQQGGVDERARELAKRNKTQNQHRSLARWSISNTMERARMVVTGCDSRDCYSLSRQCAWLPIKTKNSRSYGFVLQFAGTIAVLQDLDSTIAEFGGRPLRSVVRSFFVDLYELVRTPRTISASMNIQLESVTLTGHAASMHVESNGTLEDRVANLERRMRRQKPTSLKPRKRLHEPMINSANELMRKLRQGKVRGSACLIE